MLWPAYALLVASLASAEGPSTNFTMIETFHQCQPALIQWVGGEGPYSLSVDGGDVSVRGKRKILFSTYEHSFEWMVDVPSGINFNLSIQDEAHPYPEREVQLSVQPGPENCTLHGQPTRNLNLSAASSSSAAPQQASKSKTNVGAIVGGVVGGVVGGLIILGLLLWNLLLRRKLKRQEAEKNKYKEITPFDAPVAASLPSKPTPRDSMDLQPSSGVSSTLAVIPPAPRSEVFSQSHEISTASATRASSSTHPASAVQDAQVNTDTAESQYEQDGGPVPRPPGRVVHPPKYNSVWKT